MIRKSEKIKLIESLNIGPYKAAELIWLIEGCRLATDLELYPWNSSKLELEKVLKFLNLSYEYADSLKEQKAQHLFLIANNKKNLNLLKKAIKQSNHYEYGILMGYPETAVTAFTEGNILDSDSSSKVDDSFVAFALSKDYWREEIEYKHLLEKKIEENSQKLFDQLKAFKIKN